MADLVPLPNDFRALSRRLANIEDTLAQLQGRRLANTSLTSGTLRIAGGGNIEVIDGGSVRIHDGGRLITDAPAAASVAPSRRLVAFSHKGGPLSIGLDWTNALTYTITPPTWATSAAVHAGGTFVMQSSAGPDAPTVSARIVIGTDEGIDTLAVSALDSSRLTWSSSHTALVPIEGANPSFDVKLQLSTPAPPALAVATSRGIVHGLIQYEREV